jgi:hypothetical protein
MKIRVMEHYDEFDDAVVCWLEVEEVEESFKHLAKQIDKENYSENCFGICIYYDDDGWWVYQDMPGCELFYVDNNGKEHWMSYELTEDENTEAIEFCKKELGR